MRSLPVVHTLREAVLEVIRSNKRDGYNPIRFSSVTENGAAQDLIGVCSRLISKPETLEYLQDAMEKYPTLLTLEDFVVRQGEEWGMSEMTIETANARAILFDKIAGGRRYSPMKA